MDLLATLAFHILYLCTHKILINVFCFKITKLERKVSVTSSQNVELRRLVVNTMRFRDGRRTDGAVADVLEEEFVEKQREMRKLEDLLYRLQQHYQQVRQRKILLQSRISLGVN